MSEKDLLIKEQKEMIASIMERYDVSLTEIARRIKKSQTTITRFYNGTPLTALGSVTITALKKTFPLDVNTARGDDDGIRDSEKALIDLFKDVFQLLIYHDLATTESINTTLTYQIGQYQVKNRPGAVSVMREVQEWVCGEGSSSEKRAIQKLLQPAPAGSA